MLSSLFKVYLKRDLSNIYVESSYSASKHKVNYIDVKYRAMEVKSRET